MTYSAIDLVQYLNGTQNETPQAIDLRTISKCECPRVSATRKHVMVSHTWFMQDGIQPLVSTVAPIKDYSYGNIVKKNLANCSDSPNSPKFFHCQSFLQYGGQICGLSPHG